MADSLAEEIVQLTQRLLESISSADWPTYEELCDPSLTAFEPEAVGRLVQGMEFHRFYFDLGGIKVRHNTTITTPHVRFMGDVAVISYVRLIQRATDVGPVTNAFEETRIWQKQNGRWKHVHFHRSAV